MMTMQNVLYRVTGQDGMELLLEEMEKFFEDFPAVRQTYLKTMESFRKELGDEAVEEEKKRIEQQITALVRYCWVRGLQANYKNFQNPANDFLDTDPEVYLGEKTARHLREIDEAQSLRRQFCRSLTQRQYSRYQGVIEYITYLETVAPKLAHYYGYLLGNELLHRFVPEYQPDLVQTLRYARDLEIYFGRPLDSCA